MIMDLPPGVRPRLRRSAVTVRFGVPLLACPLGGSGTGEAMAEARARVVTLVALSGGCGTRLVPARACNFMKR